MLKTKNIIMLVDTETVATTGNARTVHDLGYVILDRKNDTVKVAKRFLISELHTDNIEYLDRSSFYLNKKELYDNDKKAYNYTALTTYKNAITEMLSDMSKYKVTVISAYNLDFDLKALEWTTNSYAENLTERLTKKLNSLAHIDLYRLACYSILRTQQYIEYALKNELRSHTGKNIGTGAECCYKYINNNTAYEEEHTALADVYDELEILKHLLKVLTKKDIMDNEVYGIDAQAWKIVKAFATQLAKA